MLQFEHPTIFILVAILFAFLIALFIYHRDERFSSANISVKIILIALRFISLSILSIFLFKPKLLNEVKQVEKPIIVFLQDASSSILNYPDSIYYASEFKSLIEENNNILLEKFDVYSYHFSDEIHEGVNMDFEGKKTDISHAFEEIGNRFYNRNLAAVVLASDGNYNKGINPFYKTSELNCPIFTLAIGDNIPEPDLQINAVRHNEIAYFENEFPIQFDIFSNFDSDQKHQISVINNGKTIYTESINIKALTPISKEIFIEANNEGIQYYDIIINTFDGERNTENNHQKVAIEILNNLQNILILSSSPHPDIAALTTALEEGKNYKVTKSLFDEFNEEIEAYNLIILHQIPDFTNRNKNLLENIIKSETALFFIGGNGNKWSEFNKVQELVEVKTKNTMQEVFPILNKDFGPFQLTEECEKFIESATPLQAPFGDIILKEESSSLFTQKIEGINTNNELLFFAEKEEKNWAFLLAEGLWKWKLFDYQKNESHDNFNELFQSISQYLTLNKDKRKLRLQYPKMIDEGATFYMDVQLYNDNYQLIEDAEINLVLTDQSEKEFIYSFSPNKRKYQTSIKNLNKGNYKFIVNSKFKNEYAEQSGAFVVLESKLEQEQKIANWKTLKQLSSNTNGKFIKKDNFENYSDIISSNIDSNHKVYINEYLSDLIKQKSIFLLLLLCLFLEWIIRKRLGTH
ncbi:MAG: hypothetical protein CM15mP107_0660 [Bacteroidota bacterium]|nr:MAG: hypothetical protein CM15mP107_0660 [Bacteroidota bacterium]